MTGDTIRSMRMWRSSCYLRHAARDPTLTVTVVHPVGLSVASTTVTVYESATLHCEDIEFARLDAAGFVALATSEADLDAIGGVGSLSDISRTGNKVIVARGFDTNSMLVSAGCVEKGEVKGDDSVTVTTVIAAIVSIKPPGDNIMQDTVVTLTDASGAPLPDQRPVTWTVYGPAGSTAANPSNVTAISDGTWEPALPSCSGATPLRLHPNPPSTLGGFAVQMRVAWAVEEPPAYTSLAATAFTLTDLGGITMSTTAQRACAIHVSGTTQTLVCVDSSDMAHEYAITVATDGKAMAMQLGSAVTAVPAAGQHSIALVAVAGSGSNRDVYSVSDRGVLVPLLRRAGTGQHGDAMRARHLRRRDVRAGVWCDRREDPDREQSQRDRHGMTIHRSTHTAAMRRRSICRPATVLVSTTRAV